MHFLNLRIRTVLFLLPLGLTLLHHPQAAFGQFGTVGGVYIDSKGMLRETSTLSPDERLELLRAEAAEQPASRELAAGSPLRKVSLRRLEAAVKGIHEAGDAGKPLPAEMRYLAGLNGVEYVFFYPQVGDVVLAGPAEEWKQVSTGEVVGTDSGRPVLHLEDLIVALRYAFADNADEFIGCSIDPTPEGLRNHAAYVRRLGGRIDRSRLKQIFVGMEQAIGPQAATVYGIDGSSRFALTLLAADYRLKRIALGHDRPPVPQVVNYLDLAAKQFTPGGQPQHQWWFLADFDAIYYTPDELAFQLAGQGVKVATAPALLQDAGSKEKQSAKATLAARQFAETLTKQFPAVAAKIPVFAELQNLIGLSVAAELVAQKHFDADPASATSHWRPTHLLDPKACPLRQLPVPQNVPSIASYRLVRGRHWLISVSGGVEINPRGLAGREARRNPPDGKLAAAREDSGLPKDVGRWWWD